VKLCATRGPLCYRRIRDYTEIHRGDTESHRGRIKLMDIIKSIVVWFIGSSYILVTFPITFIVWLLVYPFDREKVIIHWFLMYQSMILSFLIPIWSIHIEGREKAAKGTTYVIISNHQSMLDILLVNCLRYKYKWISKIENISLPVLGWYLKMADYIIVDRNNEESKIEMLENSYNCLKKGTSVMIFPEGTRSADNEIGFFKRGAFQLALRAHVPILPVLVDGTGGILPKHGLIFSSGHHIRIKILDPIYPDAFGTDDPDTLARRLSILYKLQLKKLRAQNKKQ
jgi:1-acyl-sn-glycerol-3-phosphate acyltransferase